MADRLTRDQLGPTAQEVVSYLERHAVKKFIAVAMTALGLVFAGGASYRGLQDRIDVMDSRGTTHEITSVNEHEAKDAPTRAKVDDLTKSVVELKTDIKYIRKAVERLEEK